jgi:16S rRNA (uracil1498-N3)-methyltransferase
VRANANPVEFAGIQILKMSRIYLPITHIKENRISVTGEKARYLATVVRCKNGDELVVFDGKGNCLRTKILKADRREVVVEIMEKFSCDTESPLNIILVQGLLKGQKMDIVIQKTTELGVKEIMPVITVRSQPRETRKVARWRKIAEEASRQSGRSIIPLVHEPIEFNQFFGEMGQLKGKGKTETLESVEIIGLIFWEEEGRSLKELAHKISSPIYQFTDSPIHLLIGPEGGFTREEVTLAEGKGFFITSLGKRILRSETAAISAITLLQFLLGDLG